MSGAEGGRRSEFLAEDPGVACNREKIVEGGVVQGKADVSPRCCGEDVSEPADSLRHLILRAFVGTSWVLTRWETGHQGGHDEPMNKCGSVGDRLEVSFK